MLHDVFCIRIDGGFGPIGGGGSGGGGGGQGKPKPKPTPPPCNAKLTGDADVDKTAQYLFGEQTDGSIAEYTGMATSFMNRASLNVAGFGCNLSDVLANASNADNNGGNTPFNNAATDKGLSGLDPAACDAYKRAQAAAKNVLRGDAGGPSGAGVSDFRSDYLWFASNQPEPRDIPQGGARLTVGVWTFRNYDYRGRDRQGNAIYKFGADYLKDPKCK